MKVLNFGSLNVDYVYQVDHILLPGETIAASSRTIFAGGKGLNQSIALAKAGAPVFHAGLVGDDGDILLEELSANRVDTRFVERKSGPGGHTVIQVDKDGQNSILLFGGTNRCITQEFADRVLAAFCEGDWLVLQNEINELAYIMQKAHGRGMKIALNPSPFDSNLDSCDLSLVNLFMINEIEGGQITGEKDPEKILERMKQLYGGAQVLLTLGGDGSLFRDGESVYRQPVFKVRAVDTTAAGDTFTGYFLTGLLEDKGPEEALRTAAKAAAIAVTRPGAAGSIPCRDEVARWQG